MAWNIFLAIIPVIMAYAIADILKPPEGRRTPVRVLAFLSSLVWFFFLPNTCYLLTEWRHFLTKVDHSDLYVRWRMTGDADIVLQLMSYTLFYLCYSGVGVITFALAIRPMDRLLRKTGATMWVWAIPFFVLMSLGVYLGLILRFNSWDMVTRPEQVWAVATSLRFRPNLSVLIVLFGGFLWLLYEMMDIWIDGLVCRWRGLYGPKTAGESEHPDP